MMIEDSYLFTTAGYLGRRAVCGLRGEQISIARMTTDIFLWDRQTGQRISGG